MRRGLAWTLAATLLATAAVVGRDGPGPAPLVHPLRRAPGEAPPPPPRDGASQGLTRVSAVPPELPHSLPRMLLPPAKRDLFLPVAPQAPRVLVRPAQRPPAITNIAPPSVPTAPPMASRFLGRMVTPSGERLVFLLSGERTLVAKPGDHLDDGYVVETVSDQQVILVYPALNVKVAVPLPPVPDT